MIIDVYCNDGSPLGVIPPDVYGKGVGGAELALVSWGETMARRGHLVRIYNNPAQPGNYDGVEYLRQIDFNPAFPRDAFVAFRSPNPFVKTVRNCFKIHWSCDQYTVGNFATDVFPFVDRVVCISPFHVEYHKRTYNVEPNKIGYFDLGVRLDDYDRQIKKIKGRCIFCSVPDRGLNILRAIWPELKEEMPEASLVITSDYRLWGAPGPINHHFRLDWASQKDIAFLGKVERQRLVKEQLAAQVLTYPCTYDELHCISASECQVAGAVPVTTGIGALRTTNQFGHIIEGAPVNKAWRKRFIEAVLASMEMPEDERQRRQERASNRFDWNRICAQWEGLIRTGQFTNGGGDSDHE